MREIISSDGKVTLVITEIHNESYNWLGKFIENQYEVYSTSFDVRKTDFEETKVGMGVFEREVIECTVGRVGYSLFTIKPSQMSGKVKLEFQRPDGQILKGEVTVLFQ